MTEIARTHGKYAAQVVIRWHLRISTIVTPKSAAKPHCTEMLGNFRDAPPVSRALRQKGAGRVEPDAARGARRP